MVNEVRLDALRRDTPVLPLGLRAHRRRKGVPVDPPHEVGTGALEHALGARVYRRDAEVAVHQHVGVAHLVEHLRRSQQGAVKPRLEPRPLRAGGAAHHLSGGVEQGDVDATDAPGLVRHRPVGDREVQVVDRPVSLATSHGKVGLLERDGLAGLHARVCRRGDVPQLRPTVPGRLSERRRVFGREERDGGVVVELDECRAPEEHRRKPGAEGRGGRGAKALRPSLDGAEGSRRPVDRAAERPHLA